MMATFDTSTVYTLTNAYTARFKVLAVAPSGPAVQMDATGSGFAPSASAEWFLTMAEASPFYRLHTISLGEGQSLDVLNDNGTSSINLQMAATGASTGQYWRFDAWSASDGGGYRLSNNFTGLDMHVDVYSDTLQPHLAIDDTSSGQRWTFNPAPTDFSVVPPGVASATSSSTSASATNPSPSSDGGGGSGLSAGAIAGIAVGGLAALALAIGVIAYIVIENKKGKAKTAGGTQDVDAKAKNGDMTHQGIGSHAPVYTITELGAEEYPTRPHELPSSERG
ncbi:hypothetical protein F5Y19DRAFT_424049 [Xylariaceae sp. FL1651]|nr:hypothetical protein F5Y19DRAFT_424049 [Xylariaceae sp. FL1651]